MPGSSGNLFGILGDGRRILIARPLHCRNRTAKNEAQGQDPQHQISPPFPQTSCPFAQAPPIHSDQILRRYPSLVQPAPKESPQDSSLQKKLTVATPEGNH